MTTLSDRQSVAKRRCDLYLHQGATYHHNWAYVDPAGVAIDISGAAARLQMRDGAGTLLYEATTANGQLTLAALAGVVALHIPAATNAAWAWRTASYDLELEMPDLDTDKLGWGRVRVKPEITR